MGRIEYSTTAEQIAALAARKVSALELTELAIGRIERHDAAINAVVVKDFERARSAACEADAARARGEAKPLLGVPMTVKESFNVAGLPTTWGIAAAKDWMASEDAVAVQRLKAAGAVVLGKTNLPVFLADWQSYNDIYGTTNNPWDVTRSPGGSSGGSAASLAAGYVALELGSDIGGSLRVPAHFCGVFAHKPSYALVPMRGHVPPRVPPLPNNLDLAVAGPMARSAADLTLALDLIAGPDDHQAIAYRLALPPPRHTELKDFRVLVIDTHPAIPTDRATQGVLAGLADSLAKAGVRVEHASPLVPDLSRMATTYLELLISIFTADIPLEAYRRAQDHAATVPAADLGLGAARARGAALTHRDWIKADRERVRFTARWRDLFAAFDVVLSPVMPTPAFPHDHTPEQNKRRVSIDGAEHSYMDQIVWPSIATLTGLPVTAAPIGHSPGGLPIGVQIIGPYLEDRTPLAFAALIEREIGGFVAPSGF
jgi:amidase